VDLLGRSQLLDVYWSILRGVPWLGHVGSGGGHFCSWESLWLSLRDTYFGKPPFRVGSSQRFPFVRLRYSTHVSGSSHPPQSPTLNGAVKNSGHNRTYLFPTLFDKLQTFDRASGRVGFPPTITMDQYQFIPSFEIF